MLLHKLAWTCYFLKFQGIILIWIRHFQVQDSRIYLFTIWFGNAYVIFTGVYSFISLIISIVVVQCTIYKAQCIEYWCILMYTYLYTTLIIFIIFILKYLPIFLFCCFVLYTCMYFTNNKSFTKLNFHCWFEQLVYTSLFYSVWFFLTNQWCPLNRIKDFW